MDCPTCYNAMENQRGLVDWCGTCGTIVVGDKGHIGKPLLHARLLSMLSYEHCLRASCTETRKLFSTKYKADNRRAEKWVKDCGIAGWLLDLKTGEVVTVDGERFQSMLAFADSHGYGKRNQGNTETKQPAVPDDWYETAKPAQLTGTISRGLREDATKEQRQQAEIALDELVGRVNQNESRKP